MAFRDLFVVALVSGAVAMDAVLAGEEAKKAANPIVVMETSEGTLKLELWPDKAPVSVRNFLRYADEKFYDGTIFHRVIANFMIQGGGLTADLRRKQTRDPIKNEARADLKNLRGTVAMARTADVDSATSQFFINVKDNPGLDHRSNDPDEFGYAVFGKVVGGMDVVDKIRKAPTATKGGYQDVPVTTILIKSVRPAAEGK